MKSSFTRCILYFCFLCLGEEISIGVRMAAKHWNQSSLPMEEKCRNLEKDCMNAPSHCFGFHDECAGYFCEKSTSLDARERIKLLKVDGVYYDILGLCQRHFANKAKSLLAGFDTNVVEGFNSIIAKFLGKHSSIGSFAISKRNVTFTHSLNL